MAKIELDPTTTKIVVELLQRYFEDELDQEIGNFEAQFLLDFFADKVGCYFYNQGLADALSCYEGKLDDVRDAIFQLERSPSD